MLSAAAATLASCLLLLLTPRFVAADNDAADVSPSKLSASPTPQSHVDVTVPITQDVLDMAAGDECIVNVSSFQGGSQPKLFQVAVQRDIHNGSREGANTCYHLLLRCFGDLKSNGVSNLSIVAISCTGEEDMTAAGLGTGEEDMTAAGLGTAQTCMALTRVRRDPCRTDSPRDADDVLQSDTFLAGLLSGVAAIILLVVAATVFRRSKSEKVDAENAEKPPSALSAIQLLSANMAIAAGSPLKVIPSSVLKLGDRIGAGRYGVVYAATVDMTESSEPVSVAVKTLKFVSENSTETQALLAEMSMMQTLSGSEHVVEILLGGLYQGQPCMVMERMERGDLHTYLSHVKASADLLAPDLDMIVSPYEVLDMSLQIVKGMNCLSENKIVHRDLAARNLLIREEGDGRLQVKIGDLGLSRKMLDDSAYHSLVVNTSPMKWMSVDTIEDAVFSSKSDVWSFGVVVWEIVTCGETPYPDVENCSLQAYLKSGKRLLQPIASPDEIYRMMTFCWHADPDDRPSFEELITISSEHLRREKDYLGLVGEAPKDAKSSPLPNMDIGRYGESDNNSLDLGRLDQAVQRKSEANSLVLPALTTPFHGFEPSKRFTLPPGLYLGDHTEAESPIRVSRKTQTLGDKHGSH